MIYDTECRVKGSSPYALRSFLAETVLVPVEHMCIAKHKVEAFDWLPIEDSSVQVVQINYLLMSLLLLHSGCCPMGIDYEGLSFTFIFSYQCS